MAAAKKTNQIPTAEELEAAAAAEATPELVAEAAPVNEAPAAPSVPVEPPKPASPIVRKKFRCETQMYWTPTPGDYAIPIVAGTIGNWEQQEIDSLLRQGAKLTPMPDDAENPPNLGEV